MTPPTTLTILLSIMSPLPFVSNVPRTLEQKIGRNLHCRRDHPLNLVRRIIERHFRDFDSVSAPVSPAVPIRKNFDDLLIPADHVSRGRSDTYYVAPETCLRTHTTAHEAENYFRRRFLLSGDVYRRDEIDRTHFPVFHQMEGVKLFDLATGKALKTATEQQSSICGTTDVDHSDVEEGPLITTPAAHNSVHVQLVKDNVLQDLRSHCEKLMTYLFNLKDSSRLRWSDDYFPFTNPSLELEVSLETSEEAEPAASAPTAQSDDGGEDVGGPPRQWLEVLGSGVLEDQVLRNAGVDPTKITGWALGFGLERLAMLLFRIPDIRLFWSEDERFLRQFYGLTDDLERGGERWRDVKFEQFSKYPAIAKDISFWLGEKYHENDFYEILRDDFSTEIMGEEEPEQPEEPFSCSGPSKESIAFASIADKAAIMARSAVHAGDRLVHERDGLGENLVESVSLVDEFTHPKTGKQSKTYRIVYRDMSKTLTHEQINRVQHRVASEVQRRLGVTLR